MNVSDTAQERVTCPIQWRVDARLGFDSLVVDPVRPNADASDDLQRIRGLMMTVIVVADTVRHARTIAMDMAEPGGYATSPRSLTHYGAGRGIANVTAILVDESVPWPLDPKVVTELEPHGAPIYRRCSAGQR